MKTKLFASLPVIAALTACAGTGADHQPIVDGAKSMSFQQDLSGCKQLAKSKRWNNPETRQDLLIGTVVGAALGAAEGNSEDAIGGALGGALGGGLVGATKLREDRKAIVIRCMHQRGHNVVG